MISLFQLWMAALGYRPAVIVYRMPGPVASWEWRHAYLPTIGFEIGA